MARQDRFCVTKVRGINCQNSLPAVFGKTGYIVGSLAKMPPSNMSTDDEWNLSCVFQTTKKHILGSAVVHIADLVVGSNMRRVGKAGATFWYNKFKTTRGFDSDNHYMRVIAPDDKLEIIQELVKSEVTKYNSIGIELPSTGPHLGRFEPGHFGNLPTIDGMHRQAGLTQNHTEWEADEKTLEDTNPFEYVKVVFYKPTIRADMVVLAKACNDITGDQVPEDKLERITFMQAIIEGYRAQPGYVLGAGKKDVKSAIVKYLFAVT